MDVDGKESRMTEPHDFTYIKRRRELEERIDEAYVKWLHEYPDWEAGCGIIAKAAFVAGWEARASIAENNT